ncbi:MAG: NAD-dependent epimerase/dehydratase family protein [Desulfobacteraceae bacterium]
MRNQKVVVTGGGGFLGRAVVSKLLEEGARVTSFSRQYYPGIDHSGVVQVQGDLADKEAVIKALSGVDTVFHVAAKAGIWGNRDDFFRANVTGTQHVIQGCLENRVKRLVHTSSPSVVFHGGDMEGVDESVPYPELNCYSIKNSFFRSLQSLQTRIECLITFRPLLPPPVSNV